MKKLIFFLFALIFFVSCGNDSKYEPDIIESEQETQTSQQKRKPKSNPQISNKSVADEATEIVITPFVGKIIGVNAINDSTYRYTILIKSDSSIRYFDLKKPIYSLNTEVTNALHVVGKPQGTSTKPKSSYVAPYVAPKKR